MENRDIDILERILAGIEEPKHLPLRILETITDGFSEERKIGMGGFGAVYKGVLPNGSSVAVKRMFLNIYTVDDSKFIGEVTSLLKIINHPNVVRFLGFCSSTEIEKVTKIGSHSIILAQSRERLLCFEYIDNGSLDKHLTDELRGLEWDTRYEIIRGICEGLRYLHEEKGIIHMDLKPENIMINSYMVPKITDFGLSRPDEKSHTIGDRFVSRGYCAPEYKNSGRTTLKCDIYSLGVIINDLVTGRKGNHDINNVIRRWRHRWNKLPRLSSQDRHVKMDQVIKCMEIAKGCMKNKPRDRPCILAIIRSLDGIGNMMNCHISGQIIPSLDDDMLGVEPLELHFPFEINKEISCEVELTNGTANCIAFNIETPSLYSTEPNKGILRAQSKRTVVITMLAQETTSGSEHHHDEVTVRSIKVDENLQDKNISERMFISNEGDEVNLTVVYDKTEKLQVDKSLELLAETNVPVSKVDSASTSSDQDAGLQHAMRLNFNPAQIILATNMSSKDKTQIQGSVDPVTGVMGSLIPKLGQLLEKGHNLPKNIKRNFESLQRQLVRMQASLLKVSLVQQEQVDPQDRHWANEVRELSSAIENVVDDLLLRFKEDSQTSSNTDNNHDGLEELKEKIDDIMDRVKEVAPWKVSDPLATPSAVDTRALAFFNDNQGLIGINGPRDQLAEKLMGGDGGTNKLHLKIISIFGPGGVGKTTLAKAVYDMLQVEFYLKAFVQVGSSPDMKIVLERILLKLDKNKYGDIHNKRWEEEDLILELRHLLDNKRYLIVIDDIWEIKSWEMIKCALIDNGKGSRIITTSRNFEVAKSCGEVCEIEPLL